MAYTELSVTRRRWIADLAETAFADAGSVIPVQPTPLIEDQGITFSTGDYGNAFDGVLEHRGGQFHIYCNVRETDYPGSTRARFTVGHELGHYFIDEHRNALASGRVPAHRSFIDKAGTSVIETEANTFSSHLLMPQHDFRKSATKEKPGLQGLLNLSSTFNVSAQATAIRYVEECPVPCAAMMFRPGKRPWPAISPTLRKLGYDYGNAPEVTALPEGFASRTAHEAVSGGGLSPVFEAPSTASFWFAHVTASSPRNCVIVEQAVRLGPFGVLTLLLFPRLS
ncbi:MAG TPA: ImmA/IrrE family metallo-endopeptidase [Lacipirellulaceae bacterium]|nr:ImmA/IrrE family metallo-endopeptidase [Lacipirellulaceae bacterium]